MHLKNYKWVYVLIVVFTLLTKDSLWRNWISDDHPFQQDVDQYYSYCIAAWVKNDLSFKSLIDHGYWIVPMPEGGSVQRFTYGMALMYTPFFLLAHLYAQLMGFPYSGYSYIYGFFISAGTCFYVFMGFYFLRKSLLKFYSEKIAATVIFSLFLCTNLFYYTVGHGEMSHSYLFSIYCLYIYSTIRWHEEQKAKYLYIAMFCIGLATLIRPTEIFNSLFFIFYSVYNKESLFLKLHLLKKHLRHLLFSFIFFFLPIIPQLLYWKIYGGDWIIYTYKEEGFFFSDPKMIDVLFSYRNGLLIYSPILIFAILGFVWLYNHNRKIFWGSFLCFVSSLYIVSCWWAWWFGGGFGYRALIQVFAFLAFPLAAFSHAIDVWRIKLKIFSIVKNSFVALILLIFFMNNLTRHNQYKHSIIHWDAMSKEAFWYTGWGLHFSQEKRDYLQTLYVHPDYDNARKGIRR